MFFWQLLAYLIMFVDHSVQLLPDRFDVYAFALGRLAFPLFLYGIVQGYKYTKSRNDFLIRLLILAFITEPFYYLYFSHHLNEIFYFLYALSLLALHDRSAGSAYVLALGGYFLPDYFFYSGLMSLAMYLLDDVKQLLIVFFILLVATITITPLQFVGILYFPIVRMFKQPYIRIPRVLKYSFYPGHLFLFLIMLKILGSVDIGC